MSAKRAERLQVMLTIDEVRRVEEWRYENRMPSRSAAVRALMNLGLRAHAAIDEAALLDRSVASQDVGVMENGPLVETSDERPAVLVAATDTLVGQGLGRLLEQAGFRVIGPAGAAEEVRALASGNRVAAAVLDSGVGSEAVSEIADRLAGRAIPLAIVTDDEGASPPPEHGSARMVSRAGAEEKLARVVAELIS